MKKFAKYLHEFNIENQKKLVTQSSSLKQRPRLAQLNIDLNILSNKIIDDMNNKITIIRKTKKLLNNKTIIKNNFLTIHIYYNRSFEDEAINKKYKNIMFSIKEANMWGYFLIILNEDLILASDLNTIKLNLFKFKKDLKFVLGHEFSHSQQIFGRLPGFTERGENTHVLPIKQTTSYSNNSNKLRKLKNGPKAARLYRKLNHERYADISSMINIINQLSNEEKKSIKSISDLKSFLFDGTSGDTKEIGGDIISDLIDKSPNYRKKMLKDLARHGIIIKENDLIKNFLMFENK